ncbi:undecaprenyldiphospho-muramoylpentapeptide beta-N-acetylglucosaminyltransferase [Phorcysia thermohydrogeniphila]|uniref:UDP-N-acetylglucosamine--N-acetylmuramyl-(pentapeptide) pyrophosphoryl-undecaprenol N-acetylglucosamine transferase n=1 Tax=Phorcysia thermohydrogeniphila TaxID=936138 RepID=A0A4R1GPH8_9BACT|nr:undecaprenyldiphospho-muramoylpentapeptide beta-N-acetylglucosaminyltransferase [Phorcysia thermohydrogeniphila]TCK06372.1 UDP-N-acetylglucosamine-N-acetylmuramylpentapeptide N-acetylglucosamine transferase [Phorcysia thermohydrogeniphila]
MRIIVSGGGTGGHLFPCLAVSKRLIEEGHEVLFVGSTAGIESRKRELLPSPSVFIDSKGVRGKGVKSLLNGFSLLKSIWQAFSVISSFKPDRVVLFGGYVSFPLGVAATVKGVPLILQEQNSIPGKTNLLLSRFAKKVLVGYRGATGFFNGKAVFTGNPVRGEILEAVKNKESLRKKVLRALSLSEKKKTLLVVGGSQGALWINETMKKVAPELTDLREKLQIIHVTGEGKSPEMEDIYRKEGIEARVFTFYPKIWELYSVADAAVSRAGALAISEILLFGIPTLFIPFPYAVDDHQFYNAKELYEAGACILKRQEELTPKEVATTVKLLLFDIMAGEISKNMKRLAIFDSTERVVREIING